MVDARQRLADRLQAKVQLTSAAGGKGKITIAFASQEDLERIMATLGMNDN